MKSLSRVFLFLSLVLGACLADLACKVNTPSAPSNYQTALSTIVAANPTFTPTATPTVTPTPTITPTPTVTPTPTITVTPTPT